MALHVAFLGVLHCSESANAPVPASRTSVPSTAPVIASPWCLGWADGVLSVLFCAASLLETSANGASGSGLVRLATSCCGAVGAAGNAAAAGRFTAVVTVAAAFAEPTLAVSAGSWPVTRTAAIARAARRKGLPGSALLPRNDECRLRCDLIMRLLKWENLRRKLKERRWPTGVLNHCSR